MEMDAKSSIGSGVVSAMIEAQHPLMTRIVHQSKNVTCLCVAPLVVYLQWTLGLLGQAN